LTNKRSLRQVVKDTALILNSLGLDYAFVGGIAVSGWGVARTTADVDVILNLKESDADRLAVEFAKFEFSVSPTDIRAALKEQTHFTIFDDNSAYRIDAKGAYGESERQTLSSRKQVVLQGVKCFLASAEDTIANKLLYGSEQDLRDADGIFTRQFQSLDIDKLRDLCKRLGVLRELSNLEKRVKAMLSNREEKHLKRFEDRREGS
jgi:hypothetical protein